MFNRLALGARFSHSVRLLFALSLLVVRPCLAAEPPAVRPTRPMLAVMPLTARSVDSESVEGLTSALATELLNTGKVRVMERSQMARILAEQGFQQSAGCDGSECAVEMGRLLAVDRMVLGSISKIGSLYAINVRLVDVGTGEILRSVTRNGQAKMEVVLTELVPKVAGELVADGTRTAASARMLEQSTTISPPSGARPVWPWIAGGVAVVGGGAAAYFLLAGDETSAVGTPDSPGSSGATIRATW